MAIGIEATKVIFVVVFSIMQLLILSDLFESGWYNGEPILIVVSGLMQLVCIAAIIIAVMV